MESPSQQLAKKIMSRLVTEKLLLVADEAKLISKLAEGTLTAADWRLGLENAAEKAQIE